jgi:peptide deformylase
MSEHPVEQEDVEQEDVEQEEAEQRPSAEERRAWQAAARRLVRQFPDPVLKNPASEVAEVDDEVRALIDRMTDVMSTAHGVGLAAPQIGVSRRVLIYRGSEEEGVRALVNPAFVERSEETEVDTEGCLSLLGGDLSVPIERHVRVRVSGLDAEGQPVEIEAEGLEARIIQHEVDHLDGVLITDRVPAEDRRTALRELRLRAG